MSRWFLPIKGELRVGGRYQLEGNAGGVIEECEPPSRFRVTWEMGEAMSSWVTVTLAPEGEATRLELEHVGHVPEELWAQFGPSATGLGWDMAVFGLGRHVETGAVKDPAETVAWMASVRAGVPAGVRGHLGVRRHRGRHASRGGRRASTPHARDLHRAGLTAAMTSPVMPLATRSPPWPIRPDGESWNSSPTASAPPGS